MAVRDAKISAEWHRVAPPESTWRRARSALAVAGVTRVANLTGLDRPGIAVAMATRPMARNITISQGKGGDVLAARVGAAMEALELWAAEWRPGEAIWRARRDDGNFLWPAHLAHRRESGARARPWRRGRELNDGGTVFVPEELVVADFVVPRPRGHGAFASTTNGLAAGNTWNEAVAHALCELIERDAFALFTLAPMARARRALDLATVSDPACRRAIERFRGAGIAVAAWDIATDLGVPAFVCEIDDARGHAPHLGRFAGTGCHSAPEIALLRALNEAAQSRLAIIAGAREDIAPGTYDAMGWHGNLAGLVTPPEAYRGRRAFGRVPSLATPTLAGDIAAMLERLRHARVGAVVAVDLTQAENGIPVARVIAPGLEGMRHRAGYRPGPRAAHAAEIFA